MLVLLQFISRFNRFHTHGHWNATLNFGSILGSVKDNFCWNLLISCGTIRLSHELKSKLVISRAVHLSHALHLLYVFHATWSSNLRIRLSLEASIHFQTLSNRKRVFLRGSWHLFDANRRCTRVFRILNTLDSWSYCTERALCIRPHSLFLTVLLTVFDSLLFNTWSTIELSLAYCSKLCKCFLLLLTVRFSSSNCVIVSICNFLSVVFVVFHKCTTSQIDGQVTQSHLLNRFVHNIFLALIIGPFVFDHFLFLLVL